MPLDRLATSTAPLGLVFRELSSITPATIAAVAIVATLNTIIAEMTMATRVIYGMAKLGDLPRAFGAVSGATGTPLAATAAIAATVLVLALAAPLERLAEWTSLATLTVFAMVNAALLKLRRHQGDARGGSFKVPIVVPVLGLLTSAAMVEIRDPGTDALSIPPSMRRARPVARRTQRSEERHLAGVQVVHRGGDHDLLLVGHLLEHLAACENELRAVSLALLSATA